MNRTVMTEQARRRRHAHIRRGMRIALYEVKQALAGSGMKIAASDAWIADTVVLAEGGRKKAPWADTRDRILLSAAAEYAKLRARRFVETLERVFA